MFKLKSRIKTLLVSSLSLSILGIHTSYAAATVDPTTEPLFAIAPYALSDTDVSSGNVNAYRPWFENGAWQGDIIEYDVSSSGILSTTVDSSVNPPTTTTGGNWSARIQFDAQVTADSTWWDTGRKIIFLDTSSTQKAFRWTNLSATQQTNLVSQDKLNYVRGDQSNETDKTGGTLRQRFNLLGDIIHSNPVYVQKPDSPFSLAGYDSFRNNKSTSTPVGYSDRPARVYVGANDGMVHAFDAATGNEVWAYVPSMIIGELDKLSAVPFNHTYFVDGQLSEGDADFGTTGTPEWHSLLVGGLGSGGKGLFALDITNADLSSETSTAAADKKILWEISGSDDDMGYVHGQAQIARLPEIHGSKWVIISGNGYNSTNGKAVLMLIDKNGTITKLATDTSTSNGLSAPTLVDVDNDFDVDYGYAGDLLGNMWKFDFTKKPIVVTKLFAAGSGKPITSAPDVRRHPSGGRLVYFGTGSLLSATDATDTTTQSIYGIWDGAPTANTTILKQTLGQDTYTYDPGTGPVSVTVRTDSNKVIDWAVHKGWQVDLNISGERLVTRPYIRADRLQFVSHNPLTGTHGDAWLLELNYLNGGTGPVIFLDMNRDGSLDNKDLVNNLIPVGMNLGNGSFSRPQIARVSNTRDTMFINGLFLPLSEPCTVNCSGGFQLGHIDVDTDSPSGGTTAPTTSDSYCYENGDRAAGIPVDSSGNPIPPSTNPAVVRPGTGAGDGLGGSTDGHQHEYDKAHGQVYVDYINLEPRCAQNRSDNTKVNNLEKLNRVTEVSTAYNKKFFVLVGNADLSPGGTLHLGAKSWNVVVYQKMVQQKLDAWIAAGSKITGVNSFDKMMVDDDGDSLLFTITDIMNKGTFRISFNDRAIADGGLIPTQTGCVKKDPYQNMGANGDPKANTGRWRGGALFIHAMSVTDYLADTSTVVKQTPTDLYTKRTINGVDVYLKEDTTGDGSYDTFYGGLRARDKVGGVITANPAFLYESTLFWHFKGSCYGTANWAADVQGALNSSSTSSLKDQLTSLEYDLQVAEDKLAQMIADGAKKKDIDKQKKLIDKLKKKIKEIQDSMASSSVISTGVPTPPTDATPEVSPALGPNFRTGRRTWIDLTP